MMIATSPRALCTIPTRVIVVVSPPKCCYPVLSRYLLIIISVTSGYLVLLVYPGLYSRYVLLISTSSYSYLLRRVPAALVQVRVLP